MGNIGRIDVNQPEIVEALRKIGASVISLANVKHGCPDIMIGYKGETYLMEIKRKNGKLTAPQKKWHEDWAGQVAIVHDVNEALAVLVRYEKARG